MTDTKSNTITTVEELDMFIDEHKYIDWKLCSSDSKYNVFVTLDVIKKTANMDKYKWNWAIISCRSELTEEYVLENIDLPWDWELIYAHPNISLEFVEKNPKHSDEYFFGLSDNPNMTLEFLLAHPSKHWLFNGSLLVYPSDWSWKYYHLGLSKNKSFDISWYNAMPDKGWCIEDFVFSDNFSVDWIEKLPEAKWSLGYSMMLKAPVSFIINCLDTRRFLGDKPMNETLDTLGNAFDKRTKEDCVEILKWVIPRVFTYYNKVTYGYIFEMIYNNAKGGDSVLKQLVKKHFTKEQRKELKKKFW